ncbi:TetR/AcrR family transcriptional regulator C-terminal domain-containing protein [Amycolatopsis sp. NPDC049252]|uniref:TetR/AcrR family transcriptional regulator C-terminal domain-containing protein n=1 Tax=Amycolatopsis sp. NPDC049252 TaxID=3363933 RepID=UPI003716A3AF
MDTRTEPPRRGRPRRGHEPLSRPRIVGAAMALAEAEGVERLTMRGVAKRLGVDAMSLYNHVASRDALLDAITEEVLARLRLPAPSGDLEADVRAVAGAFRSAAQQYPRCATLVLTRQLGAPAALGPTEAVLAVLDRAGFPPDRAVHALRTALAFLVGSLMREVSAGPAFSGTDVEGAQQREAELRAAGLPHVAAAAPDLAICDHDEEFEFGLTALVAALEAVRG